MIATSESILKANADDLRCLGLRLVNFLIPQVTHVSDEFHTFAALKVPELETEL